MAAAIPGCSRAGDARDTQDARRPYIRLIISDHHRLIRFAIRTRQGFGKVTGIGLVRDDRIATAYHGEVRPDAKLVQDAVGQGLLLVAAYEQAPAGLGKGVERVGHIRVQLRADDGMAAVVFDEGRDVVFAGRQATSLKHAQCELAQPVSHQRGRLGKRYERQLVIVHDMVDGRDDIRHGIDKCAVQVEDGDAFEDGHGFNHG